MSLPVGQVMSTFESLRAEFDRPVEELADEVAAPLLEMIDQMGETAAGSTSARIHTTMPASNPFWNTH
jgi:hypothetical protein